MPEALKRLIQSGNPLIAIETADEERCIELIRRTSEGLARPHYEWSMTAGLRRLKNGVFEKPVVPAGKAVPALSYIRQELENATFVYKDIGPHCKDALVHRTVRDLLSESRVSRCTMIFVDALPIPNEMRRFVVKYDLKWPSADELEKTIRDTFNRIRRESLQEVSAKITKRDMEQIVQCLRGLSCREAERVIASAILDDYALTAEDLPHIVEAKRTLLGSTGCLESIAADFGIDDVGGLNNLKQWLKHRRGAFSKRAREFGIEPPRGVLMLGVPGCGKSLCAKAVAAEWKMPLLRLDPGTLYQKFVGESESQLRQALAQAETMAPVVLWIDEIEKAFASATASSADGGLSKRMFGTLLSWMQDHRHPIFIVATANDISALPPELMRKGRFDEVFFVDLPTPESRKRILAVHIERRKRNPDKFDLDQIAIASEGFTGSELEQLVVSALFAAFAQGSELADEHLLGAIQGTRPLAVLMRERIAELRAWAKVRCVPAD